MPGCDKPGRNLSNFQQQLFRIVITVRVDRDAGQ